MSYTSRVVGASPGLFFSAVSLGRQQLQLSRYRFPPRLDSDVKSLRQLGGAQPRAPRAPRDAIDGGGGGGSG